MNAIGTPIVELPIYFYNEMSRIEDEDDILELPNKNENTFGIMEIYNRNNSYEVIIKSRAPLIPGNHITVQYPQLKSFLEQYSFYQEKTVFYNESKMIVFIPSQDLSEAKEKLHQELLNRSLIRGGKHKKSSKKRKLMSKKRKLMSKKRKLLSKKRKLMSKKRKLMSKKRK
jgi:hypothetical protein